MECAPSLTQKKSIEPPKKALEGLQYRPYPCVSLHFPLTKNTF